MAGPGFDVVVVGGGSAGCALAARLAADPAMRVLLLEAGPADLPPGLRAVASLAATVAGHPRSWSYRAELLAGHGCVVPRGRTLGGSSAINGAVWRRATPADVAGWAVPGWGWDELLAHYVRAEADHDHPRAPGHGADGPVPVRRPAGPLLHPAAERFLAAASRLGFPAEPDQNAGGPPGAGLVPANAVDGVRFDAAMAYLPTGGDPPRGTGRPTVRTGSPVARVLLDRDRASGVELDGGERITAGEVVLAAGAVATPHLLLRSGIGPAAELAAAGLRVRCDLPGVGTGWSDHPAVFLPFTGPDPQAHPHAPAAQAALNLDLGADPAGEACVLAFVRPFTPDGPLQLMCTLTRPDSRGVIALDPRDPSGPPRISYHYLRTGSDRSRLRQVVRTAAGLLLAGLGSRVLPGGDVLGNDRTLDGWIAGNLTTAVHLCGSAAIGRVVDARLRVHGVTGLRVADTSVLPTVPRRGTAATAVAVGEMAATLLRG